MSRKGAAVALGLPVSVPAEFTREYEFDTPWSTIAAEVVGWLSDEI